MPGTLLVVWPRGLLWWPVRRSALCNPSARQSASLAFPWRVMLLRLPAGWWLVPAAPTLLLPPSNHPLIWALALALALPFGGASRLRPPRGRGPSTPRMGPHLLRRRPPLQLLPRVPRPLLRPWLPLGEVLQLQIHLQLPHLLRRGGYLLLLLHTRCRRSEHHRR